MKAWFITGASGGLGRELATLALSEGDTVIAAVRRPDALRDLLDASGPRLVIETLDVTSSADIARVAANSLARGQSTSSSTTRAVAWWARRRR